MVVCNGRLDVKGHALCQAGIVFFLLMVYSHSHALLATLKKLLFQALLSGCSAGGLASILHCDEFRGLFSRNTKVKCLSDAGMFLDA